VGALALLLCVTQGAVAQATGSVTGVVRNAVSGEPIAGAQVSILGTGIGVLANNVGRFLVLNIPAGEVTVRAQFIGYTTMNQTVNVPAGGTVTVEFALRSEAISLEGVVVTGTAGQARRREVGNSIAQINAAQIENVPLLDAADILVGRAAGVTVQLNSGQVGVGSSVRMRGNNSVAMGNNPLIYVDGVRIRDGGSSYQDESGQSISPLSDINPDDIERVEVIKGAAASTLYGTEASGGVIQIFTKRGAAGAAAWSGGFEVGFNEMGHFGPKEIENGLWMNDCTELGAVACPYGSWLDRGLIHKYNLSVRGGSEVSNYYLSATWGDERGVIETGDFGDDEGQQSYAVRGNFSFSPRDNLSIRFNNSFIHKDTKWFPDGDNAEGFLLNVLRKDADYTPDGEDGLILGMKLNTLTDHFTTGVNVVYTTGGMSHRFNGGLDWAQNDYQEEHPYEYWRVPLGNREVDQYLTRKLTFDYAGNWDLTLGADFRSQTAWGGQLYDDFIFRLNGFGDDFAGPGDKVIDSAARTEAYETRRNITNGGFFIQEMVGWKDKLFLTGGLRVDGHSSFGSDFGWAPYPKVALAYSISDESFWPAGFGQMKLRSAFGESGKAPGVFDAVRTWDAVSGDDGQPGVTPDNLGNPALGPERTREFEIGAEGSLFDGRVTYEYTYYDQETTDALIYVQQLPSGGFTGTQLENVGHIDNKGHEFAVNFNAVSTADFIWDLGVNVSTNKSNVISLGGLNSIYIGWRNEARPGLALPTYCHEGLRDDLKDAVGVTPVIEQKCYGPTYPTHTYAINTSFTMFERLTLDVLGEGQGGHVLSAAELYQNTRRFVNPLCYDVQDKVAANQTSDLRTEDWARCDRAYTSYGAWVQAADFFKLRSAALSYRVPEHWLPGNMRGATIRLQGRNLFKITDFQGLDPEVSEDGINSLYRQGYYHLPAFRTFLLNVKIDF
jgi:TonB-dependent SusC/RagA subfamily outer membrane receptor